MMQRAVRAVFTPLAEGTITGQGLLALFFTVCPQPTSGSNPPVAVNLFNLTQEVIAPAKDAALDPGVDTGQYSGVITWKKIVNGGADEDFIGNFAVGVEYEAAVVLTAKEGFMFDGVGGKQIYP